MTSRIFAAGIVVLGIGATMAPVETSAGSGGLPAAPSAAASALVRPSFTPPHPVHRFGGFPTHTGGFRMSEPSDRRVAGFPLWWGWPDYYPFGYGAFGYGAPYAEPAPIYPTIEEISAWSRPAVAHVPECRTDTQKVPSETGGERTINITRCY